MEPSVNPTRNQATIRDLVAAVFRQKWVILTLFAVTTAGVFLFTLRSPTTFESSARVEVRRGRVESTQQSQLRVLTWKEEMASELEMVRSQSVRSRAQDILDHWHAEGLLDDPIPLGGGGIEARVIGDSNVLEISYTAADPAVCRPVTNAVTEAYADVRNEAMEVPGVASFFEYEIERVSRQLADLEQEKRDFIAQVGPTTGREAEMRFNQLLIRSEDDLRNTENELGQVRKQLAQVRELRPDRAAPALFQQLGLQNASTLYNMRNEVLEARIRKDELAATLTPQHPDMIAADEALTSAEKMLDEELTSTIEVLENRSVTLRERADRLRDEVNRLQEQAVAVPTNDVRLAQLDNEIDLLRGELRLLNDKATESRINRATSHHVTVTLLSEAGPPYPKKTRDLVRLGLAPLMSLVVGLLLAFFLDSVDNTFRTQEEILEHLELPVLAALPESRR